MIKSDYSIVPAELGGGTIEPTRLTASTSILTKKVRVTDDKGTPLPGAHVYFSQANGTTTNFNGEATVSTTDGDKTVYVSYVGFNPKAFKFQDLPTSVQLSSGESLSEVIVDASAKAAASDSKVPMYVFPAIGGLALLLILMSMGSPATPKEITL